MGRDQNGNDEAITQINVTPLVDIALVLLIIFMVTATLVVSPQIRVELPRAATVENPQMQTFSLVLNKDRALFLNGNPVDETQVVAHIVERLQNTPDLQVVICADRMVYHGEVIHLVDLVRRHGVRKFAINVEAERETE